MDGTGEPGRKLVLAQSRAGALRGEVGDQLFETRHVPESAGLIAPALLHRTLHLESGRPQAGHRNGAPASLSGR